jgi:hypothetical protein
VPSGCKSSLGTGKIEGDHTAATECDRSLGQLDPFTQISVTERTDDLARHRPRRSLALFETLRHSLDDLCDGEPAQRKQAGAETGFQVGNVFGRAVFNKFARDTAEGAARLHHRAGHIEGLEIPLQAGGVERRREDLSEGCFVSAGEVDALAGGNLPQNPKTPNI